jgi:hypothetical protein
MNSFTILNISLLLFTQIIMQTASAESYISKTTNNIPVIEKSLQPDTTISVSSTTKSYPLADTNADGQQQNSSAPTTSIDVETKKNQSSPHWDTAKQNAGNAWKETKDTSSNAWNVTKKGSNEVWDVTKKGSNEVWDSTKKTSVEVWDITKDGSKKAWEKTKEASSSAWKATKSGIHKGANYVSEKTKE